MIEKAKNKIIEEMNKNKDNEDLMVTVLKEYIMKMCNIKENRSYR